MNPEGNQRQAQRKSIHDIILVEDAISTRNLGRIGNLSRTGLMLICTHRLHDDALYQIRFDLPDENQSVKTIEIGVHEQWTSRATSPGQFWSGLRIIDIAPDAEQQLAGWLERA